MSLKLMNQEKLLFFIALSHIMTYRMLYVCYPVKQSTVSELRHAVDNYIHLYTSIFLYVPLL